MDKLLKPLLKGKTQKNLLTLLFILFIVLDIQVPDAVANLANNIVGKIIIVMVSISLLKIDPLLGVFGMIAGYTFIQRIDANHTQDELRFVPSETEKARNLRAMNVVKRTVEEDAVSKMEAMSRPNVFIKADYKPVLNMLHDAAKLN